MKQNKYYLLSLILFFLITIKTNFFKSFYQVFSEKYDDRLSRVYGFCDNEGIGYVNFIKKNFKIDGKIDLINSLKKNNYNSGKWYIYNPNIKENQKHNYLIIINNSKLAEKVDFEKYKILHKFKDCYFLAKYD
jgi:hypothetical protein